jgi:hypothetical protein
VNTTQEKKKKLGKSPALIETCSGVWVIADHGKDLGFHSCQIGIIRGFEQKGSIVSFGSHRITLDFCPFVQNRAKSCISLIG